jgi:hypothetical protein
LGLSKLVYQGVDMVDIEIRESLKGVGIVSTAAKKSGQLTGHRALQMAVLEDAIRCLLGTNKLLKLEAEVWFTRFDRGSLFSFEVICDAFSLSSVAVRKQLFHLESQNRKLRVNRKGTQGTRVGPTVSTRRSRGKHKSPR